MTAERGPKLGVTKINFSSGATQNPLDGDRQEAWVHCRFLDKVLAPFPFPIGGSHQDLLSGLRQTQSNQATPNERSGSQKDGDHFGYPHKRSKDGISQNGSKFA